MLLPASFHPSLFLLKQITCSSPIQIVQKESFYNKPLFQTALKCSGQVCVLSFNLSALLNNIGFPCLYAGEEVDQVSIRQCLIPSKRQIGHSISINLGVEFLPTNLSHRKLPVRSLLTLQCKGKSLFIRGQVTILGQDKIILWEGPSSHTEHRETKYYQRPRLEMANIQQHKPQSTL